MRNFVPKQTTISACGLGHVKVVGILQLIQRNRRGKLNIAINEITHKFILSSDIHQNAIM